MHLRAAFFLTKLVLPEMYARQSGVVQWAISSLSAKSAFPPGLRVRTPQKQACLALSARDRRRSRTQRRACRRHLPGARHRNSYVKRAGRDPRKKTQHGSRKAACRISGWHSSRPRAKPPTKSPAPRSFCCSEQSSATTGQSINVDGGAAVLLIRILPSNVGDQKKGQPLCDGWPVKIRGAKLVLKKEAGEQAPRVCLAKLVFYRAGSGTGTPQRTPHPIN